MKKRTMAMLPIALLSMIVMIVGATKYYNALETKPLLNVVVCSDGQSKIQLYKCEKYDHGCINPAILVSVFYDGGGGTLKYRLTPGFYELDFSSVDARGYFEGDHRNFIVTKRSDNRIERFECGSFD